MDLQRDVVTNMVAKSDFDRLVEWELEKSKKDETLFSLVALDLDGYGKICEQLGVEASEDLLRRLAEILRTHTREGDVLAKGRSDKFFLLLCKTGPDQGLLFVEDLRRLLSNSTIKLDSAGAQLSVHVSFSAGVSSFPKDGTTREEIQRKADIALYRAKTSGRNRVCLAAAEKSVLKSNYYLKSQLERLSVLAKALERTEASLLREAIDDLFDRFESVLKGHPVDGGSA